jgi:uncharacterized protein YndB with AHSA1/START domain
MTNLPHRLDRTVVIRANRETVFRFFTDSARWAEWWGAGSTIDARPGGAVLIRFPNAIEVSGEVLELTAPERIVFTYGYASGTPIPPGGSRVSIELERHEGATRLRLMHEITTSKGGVFSWLFSATWWRMRFIATRPAWSKPGSKPGL